MGIFTVTPSSWRDEGLDAWGGGPPRLPAVTDVLSE